MLSKQQDKFISNQRKQIIDQKKGLLDQKKQFEIKDTERQMVRNNSKSSLGGSDRSLSRETAKALITRKKDVRKGAGVGVRSLVGSVQSNCSNVSNDSRSVNGLQLNNIKLGNFKESFRQRSVSKISSTAEN